MNQYLRVLEYACELLGVFLLSVEAIKLANFRRLSERLLKPLLSNLNPSIEFVDRPDAADGQRTALFFCGFVVALLLTGFLALLAISGAWNTSAGILRPWEWSSSSWIQMLGAIAYALLCFLVGAIVWTAVVYGLSLLIAALEHLEENTERGIIGLLGFSLFLVYFVLKLSIG